MKTCFYLGFLYSNARSVTAPVNSRTGRSNTKKVVVPTGDSICILTKAVHDNNAKAYYLFILSLELQVNDFFLRKMHYKLKTKIS